MIRCRKSSRMSYLMSVSRPWTALRWLGAFLETKRTTCFRIVKHLHFWSPWINLRALCFNSLYDLKSKAMYCWILMHYCGQVQKHPEYVTVSVMSAVSFRFLLEISWYSSDRNRELWFCTDMNFHIGSFADSSVWEPVSMDVQVIPADKISRRSFWKCEASIQKWKGGALAPA